MLNWARFTMAAVAAVMTLFAHSGIAGFYAHPGDTFGQTRQHVISENESLIELARTYHLGFNEITAANPGIDPFVPETGTVIIIPSTRILPDIPLEPGIVINIPEMRIYYFPFYSTIGVASFPIGIGDAGMETPLGVFTIIDKVVNPSWYIPSSIRHARPNLPRVMPPGPDNPLGTHALRLSRKSILIHGTNRPFSIGRKASHGCIRLYPEDIVQLFQMVRVGTRVTIINQPVKVTKWDDQVYVEAHGDRYGNDLELAKRILRTRCLHESADKALLAKALTESRGIPVSITRRGDPQLMK